MCAAVLASALIWGAPAVAGEEEADPPRPFAVEARAQELGRLLEAAPFVHKGNLNGPALYMVSFRTCPTCLAFKAGEKDALEAAGVDLRVIVYARADREGKARSRPEERALVAELALNRDYALYEAWHAKPNPEQFYQTAELPPGADGAPVRAALVEEGRALVEALAQIVADNDQDLAIPSLFWQDGDTWHGYIGYNEDTFAPIRARLIALAAGP